MSTDAKFEPSDLAKKLYAEHQKLQPEPCTTPSKPLIDLSKMDQAHYPHFKPHIFLIEDMAETLSRPGPSRSLESVQSVIASHSRTDLWTPTANSVVLTLGEDEAASS
jgi:hypothetical protein